MYKIILEPSGIIHLKTDSDGLYHYTYDQIEEYNFHLIEKTTDLYNSDLVNEILSIKTYYERKYLANNKNINYLKFSF